MTIFNITRLTGRLENKKNDYQFLLTVIFYFSEKDLLWRPVGGIDIPDIETYNVRH